MTMAFLKKITTDHVFILHSCFSRPNDDGRSTVELDFLRRQCKLLEASTPGECGGGRINKSWTRNFDAIACNTSTAMLISLIEDSKWKLQLLGDVPTLMWDVPSVQEILFGYMLGTVFVRAN